MCTAATLKTNDFYFGRTLDNEFSYLEEVTITPRNFPFFFRNTAVLNEHYAIIGMATIIDNHPMFADGMNEKGLACAGLNFPGYAHYEENPVEGKNNLPPHDIILWTLGNFETVKEVKKAFENVEIVGKTINEQTALATLHWMVTDKNGESIVIEKTKEKLSVYDNNLSVLTNSPTFALAL